MEQGTIYSEGNFEINTEVGFDHNILLTANIGDVCVSVKTVLSDRQWNDLQPSARSMNLLVDAMRGAAETQVRRHALDQAVYFMKDQLSGKDGERSHELLIRTHDRYLEETDRLQVPLDTVQGILANIVVETLKRSYLAEFPELFEGLED